MCIRDSVHAERFAGRRAAFADVFAQQVGRHRARADQAQSARVAYGRRQPPAAAPDHAARDDRVANAEECGYSVLDVYKRQAIRMRLPRWT